MTPVVVVCAVFLIVGFAIKHAPRSIRNHDRHYRKGWMRE